jgi:hypothetical protein
VGERARVRGSIKKHLRYLFIVTPHPPFSPTIVKRGEGVFGAECNSETVSWKWHLDGPRRKDLTFSISPGYHSPTAEKLHGNVMGPLEDGVYYKR